MAAEKFAPAIRAKVQEAYAAAQSNPRNSVANGKLGMVLHAHEQYESAAVAYERARLLQPDDFRWAYYLAEVQAAIGKNTEAAATLRQALKLNTEYFPAQLKQAETLLTSGELGKSEQMYQEVIKKHPDSAAAYYGLGRVRATRGERQGALEAYKQACELFPAYGVSHYALALAYRSLGETEKSGQHFAAYEQSKATVQPLNDPLMDAVHELNASASRHLERGVALLSAGRIESSVVAHERALAIDPELAQAHVNLISLYGRLGRVDKAEEHYRALLRVNPNLADGYYNFGVVAMRRGKFAEAKAAFFKALQLNPFYGEAHNDLGYILEREGRRDEALGHFRQAVENRPDSRLARFELGRLLIDRKNYREAIHHLKKTLTPVDESTPGYLYMLGIAYARSGSWARALECLRNAKHQALALGQNQLLATIDRDLRTLDAMQ